MVCTYVIPVYIFFVVFKTLHSILNRKFFPLDKYVIIYTHGVTLGAYFQKQ